MCDQIFRDDSEMLKVSSSSCQYSVYFMKRLQHQKASHSEGCCTRCDLWYPSVKLLHKHFYDSYSHWHCVECGVGFATQDEYGEVRVVLSDESYQVTSHDTF